MIAGMVQENWERAYREAPEIFDAFSRAEDPDGVLVQRLLRHTHVDDRSVLEIGCGTGRYTVEIAPHAARYVGVERSPQMLALARARCAELAEPPTLVCGQAQRLPLPSDSVDRVIAAWVLVNMRPSVRGAALSEARRVLRPGRGNGLWLLENHWTGEFQELRGVRSHAEQDRIRAMMATGGFLLVDVVQTELRFPDAAEAERVLGYLCGEPVRERLRRNPVSRLGHNVAVLHRPADS